MCTNAHTSPNLPKYQWSIDPVPLVFIHLITTIKLEKVKFVTENLQTKTTDTPVSLKEMERNEGRFNHRPLILLQIQWDTLTPPFYQTINNL